MLVVLFALYWEVGSWDSGNLACFGRWPSSSPSKLPWRSLSQMKSSSLKFCSLEIIWAYSEISSFYSSALQFYLTRVEPEFTGEIQGATDAITHAHGSCITWEALVLQEWSWTTSSASLGCLLEMWILGVHLRPTGWNLWFNKPSGWFECSLKFENRCSREICLLGYREAQFWDSLLFLLLLWLKSECQISHQIVCGRIILKWLSFCAKDFHCYYFGICMEMFFHGKVNVHP